MIIACPSCASPFQVLDDQISPLVQVACPHCSFRMILDFQAANDPSLVDPGTQMASGYRTEADYRAAENATPGSQAAQATPPTAPPATPAAQPVAKPVAKPKPRPRTAPPAAPAAPTAKVPGPPPARAEGAPVPPPPKHKSKSKKTLIATPGMMAQVPTAPPATPAAPAVSDTDGLDTPDSLRRETEAKTPHAPAPGGAAAAWPTEAADPDAGTPSDDESALETSQELLPPMSGGALRASPAPAPPGRSKLQTFLLYTVLTCVAVVIALCVSAYLKTGEVDPRPFIQQTLIPVLKARVEPLLAPLLGR